MQILHLLFGLLNCAGMCIHTGKTYVSRFLSNISRFFFLVNCGGFVISYLFQVVFGRGVLHACNADREQRTQCETGYSLRRRKETERVSNSGQPIIQLPGQTHRPSFYFVQRQRPDGVSI